jgi:ATP-dependent Clp protease ATP-binding subunit ClpC
VFERFTERARQVVILAREEAWALNHNYIGTEHMLLGLLGVEEGFAAHVLSSLDITAEVVRAQVVVIVGEGVDDVTDQIPFTPRAKKVMELALREGLSLGQNYVGTEHLLLGLARENDGVGVRILREFGVDAEKVRDRTIRLLSGSGRRETSPRAMTDELRHSLTEVLDAAIAAKEVARSGRDNNRAVIIGHVEQILKGMLKPEVPTTPEPGD